jgi:hypothetical protein
MPKVSQGTMSDVSNSSADRLRLRYIHAIFFIYQYILALMTYYCALGFDTQKLLGQFEKQRT